METGTWEEGRCYEEQAASLQPGRGCLLCGDTLQDEPAERSLHHVNGIEVYKDRLVLYGCGDFLNDYEGIGGYERFRGDLALMYLVGMDPSTGKLVRLQMTPMQTKHLRANRASRADALWLRDTLNREGKQFRTRVEMDQSDTLTLRWD